MFRIITLFGVVLTLIITVLGSYIRLSGVDLALSNQSFINVLIGSSHVYLAATLGLLVLMHFLLKTEGNLPDTG